LQRRKYLSYITEKNEKGGGEKIDDLNGEDSLYVETLIVTITKEESFYVLS